MLSISKPISAEQAGTYHEMEWTSARTNYYAEGERITGRWEGRLRETLGLPREVMPEHFTRLAAGRHPIFDAQLVGRGQLAGAMVHRAGWDLTFSAPKSVSLVALVAGRADVRNAHAESVTVALQALEAYTQARLGGSRIPETTGKWIVATFEHDSARPVNGYSAPQLHTHGVLMNVTITEKGKTRALQPRELFQSQAFATAVYRSELAVRLSRLGYEIDRGRSGQPEIKGFTPEYLEAASPRRRQILDMLAHTGRSGAGAAEIAAHQTRAGKIATSPKAAVLEDHQRMASAFGDQPARAVAAARSNGPIYSHGSAAGAVTYATDRQFERTAVTTARALVTDALRLGMGSVRLPDIQRELAARVARGEFLSRPRPHGTISTRWTTPEMVEAERTVIARMQDGQGICPPLGRVGELHGFTEDQRSAVVHVLTSRDRIVAIDGIAGTGKTTAVAAIRAAANEAGYDVVGVAPTSRAAQRLADAGMPTQTLQRFITEPQPGRQARLLIVDEASLASTRQMLAVLEQMRPSDRVLLVGDVRQHEPVEAGVPFRQLQRHGLKAARLTTIRRQAAGPLRKVVSALAKGHTGTALSLLESEGRVHVIPDMAARLAAMTADARAGEARETLMVVPDNETRHALNAIVHRARQADGHVDKREHTVRVLVGRHDMTATDRAVATMYGVGDTLRFRKGSRALKIPARSIGVVTAVEPKAITVAIGAREVVYDPGRLTGVAVYRDETRTFAVGDRVQFTAPDRSLKVANRQLGTITAIDGGRIALHLDTGRTLRIDPSVHPHLDYGYTMTSYSAQGLTTGRVLLHIDADHAGEMLVNRRLAYVALSRGREMKVYTDDFNRLRRACAREVSHPMAVHDASRERARV